MAASFAKFKSFIQPEALMRTTNADVTPVPSVHYARSSSQLTAFSQVPQLTHYIILRIGVRYVPQIVPDETETMVRISLAR